MLQTTFNFPNGIKIRGIHENGFFYFASTSTWHSDHGALKMVDTKTGVVINEWNYHTEMDATTPDLIRIYNACVKVKSVPLSK